MGYDSVKLMEALQQIAVERNNRAPPAQHIYLGPVTTNYNYNCEPPSTAATSSIPEAGGDQVAISQAGEQFVDEEPQPSTSTSKGNSFQAHAFIVLILLY